MKAPSPSPLTSSTVANAPDEPLCSASNCLFAAAPPVLGSRSIVTVNCVAGSVSVYVQIVPRTSPGPTGLPRTAAASACVTRVQAFLPAAASSPCAAAQRGSFAQAAKARCSAAGTVFVAATPAAVGTPTAEFVATVPPVALAGAVALPTVVPPDEPPQAAERARIRTDDTKTNRITCSPFIMDAATVAHQQMPASRLAASARVSR